MPKISPITVKELIRKLKDFGFEGPFPGGKLQYMLKDEIRLSLPNPHRNEISIDLLIRILKQAKIAKEEWTNSVQNKI
jgi:predicted RNA binding protein YcfA (HicA-like mRNA interferase family)